jgi:excisionase family DNA binding protein
MSKLPSDAAPNDALLSVPAAAQRLGVGRSTLYELLGRGALEAVRIGRRTLVPAAAVEHLIATLPRAQFRAANGSQSTAFIKQTGGRRGQR